METLNLLVVDDETGMRLAVERTLSPYRIILPFVTKKIGLAVSMAASGEAALEIIRSAPPDILLLDHKLPGLSGLDVLTHLSEADAAPLTVMITAYASLETAIDAIKLGAFDFLAKPFTPEELKSTVFKAVKHIMLKRQLERTTAEKRRLRFELISMVSHELKAPLAAVESYLELINRKTMGDQIAAYERIVERCLSRMQGMRKLILDLLDLTRIESGESKRVIERFDLWEIAEPVIEDQSVAAKDKSVGIDTEGDQPLWIEAEKKEMEIILANLVSNAVKYNHFGGRVTVILSAETDGIRIVVSDSGIGLSADEIDRIFDDFYRVKTQQTRDIPGSGLGLSIVRRIVEQYQGTIDIDSRPGNGSTFTVRLPLKAAAGKDAKFPSS